MIKLSEVREGSVIQIRGDFGSGKSVRAVVTGVEKDIKNGIPGIVYKIPKSGHEYWAYLEQVDKVLKY